MRPHLCQSLARKVRKSQLLGTIITLTPISLPDLLCCSCQSSLQVTRAPRGQPPLSLKNEPPYSFLRLTSWRGVIYEFGYSFMLQVIYALFQTHNRCAEPVGRGRRAMNRRDVALGSPGKNNGPKRPTIMKKPTMVLPTATLRLDVVFIRAVRT